MHSTKKLADHYKKKSASSFSKGSQFTFKWKALQPAHLSSPMHSTKKLADHYKKKTVLQVFQKDRSLL
jgi:hypothetical protein